MGTSTIIAVLAGLGWLVGQIASFISEYRIIRRLRQRLIPIKTYSFIKEPVPANALQELYTVFVRVFGNNIMGLPVLQRITAKNPETVWRVGLEDTTKPDAEPQYIGFFEIFPLTKRAAKAVQSGKIDGRRFRETHIYSRASRGSDYYIAGLGVDPDANSRYSRAGVVRELAAFINTVNRSRGLTLYARPVTPDGLRLLEDHRFSKIDNQAADYDTTWVRKLKKGELIQNGRLTRKPFQAR